MKRLAVIGASYLQLPLIIKAKEMGYITHVFAWERNDVGEKAADFFYPISITEKEAILKKCKELRIDGICSIASDLAIITVNYVANNLGLNCNSWESTLVSSNKYLMRKAFAENGDPSPRSIEINSLEDIPISTLEYPIIVKPTDRSGSRGITKLLSSEGINEAVTKALNESFEKKALIEEFVDGDEYSVECISFKGKHKMLAITKKFTTGSPHFIETGHLEPAPLSAIDYERIKKIVFHALDTLQIKNGASHSEIKINSKNEIMLIEIGGRMGGDCIGSDLVFYSTGIDYVKCVIQVAVNECPDLKPCIKPFPVRSVFLLNENDFREFERIKKEEPSSIVRIADYQPDNLGKTTDSSNRCGCYIVKNV